MRNAWLFVFIACLFFCVAGAQATSSFTRLHLPEGLSFEVPNNWRVLSDNNVMTLNSWVEATLENSGHQDIENKNPFWAKYFLESGKSVAALSVRFYPTLTTTTQEAIQGGSRFIKNLDRDIETDFGKGIAASGGRLTEWLGTRKQDIADKTYFISEMDFLTDGEDSHGFLVRRLDADKSFTVILIYNKRLEDILQPISEKIVRSIRID